MLVIHAPFVLLTGLNNVFDTVPLRQYVWDVSYDWLDFLHLK